MSRSSSLACIFSMHSVAVETPPSESKLTNAKPRDWPVILSLITRALSCSRPANSLGGLCTLRAGLQASATWSYWQQMVPQARKVFNQLPAPPRQVSDKALRRQICARRRTHIFGGDAGLESSNHNRGRRLPVRDATVVLVERVERLLPARIVMAVVARSAGNDSVKRTHIRRQPLDTPSLTPPLVAVAAAAVAVAAPAAGPASSLVSFSFSFSLSFSLSISIAAAAPSRAPVPASSLAGTAAAAAAR